MKSNTVIELDGRTGEGGGQLVRIAVALASVACKPVKITNVRGNRPGKRGGGLKSQHVTSIEWLAKATGAYVMGLEIGSKTLVFQPNRRPGDLVERNIKIRAESPAASSLLIFQAVFPFLLFTGNERNEAIELEISGGTNVSFSLSYEYLDQVLLPTLEDWFGIHVERKLQIRGWSSGSASRGSVWFKIQPIALGKTLQLKEKIEVDRRPTDFDVRSIDISIITPTSLHGDLQASLTESLTRRFPEATLNFIQIEESKHDSRIYVLLVAKSETLRWGRDHLYSGKQKGKTAEKLSEEISKAVTKDLHEEVQRGGMVDEFIQDQLVIFQALAEGRSSFPRSTPEQTEDDERGGRSADGMDQELEQLHISEQLGKDRVKGPLGDPEADSNHTRTARWVTWEVLEPRMAWYNKATVCEGIGLISGGSSVS